MCIGKVVDTSTASRSEKRKVFKSRDAFFKGTRAMKKDAALGRKRRPSLSFIPIQRDTTSWKR